MLKMCNKMDSVVEINTRLTQQNIDLLEQIPKNEPLTNFTKPVTEEVFKKKLYYAIVGMTNEIIIISGGLTFDFKTTLKENGFEWVPEIKSWRTKSLNLEQVQKIFPDIEKKPIITRQINPEHGIVADLEQIGTSNVGRSLNSGNRLEIKDQS